MTRLCHSRVELWFVALLCTSFFACGRDVDIGRYTSDASRDASDSTDSGGSGGTGGTGGTGGDGGSGGHDECAEFEPVCGSDGVTYMNRCVALRAGILSVTRGACR